jgi:hypothetical protein
MIKGQQTIEIGEVRCSLGFENERNIKGAGLVYCILSHCYVIKQHGKTVKARI